MTITVAIQRDDLVDVTVTPSWLARLFGSRPSKRRARRYGDRWLWASTAERVPERIVEEIWIQLDRETSRFAPV